MSISQEARLSVPQNVLVQELDGETVLLNLQSGQYYGLNEVGTRIWTLLVEHGLVETACRAILDEYGVDEHQLRKDVSDLVSELAAQKLLSIDTE